MLMGIWEGKEWVRIVDMSRLFLCLEMGAFLRVIILEGEGVNDFTTGSEVMEGYLTVGEDCVEEEGPILREDCSRFAFRATFICKFLAFSKLIFFFFLT